MKIIDNKKDYYDYLSGIYGIDDLIVYDRRGSVPSRDIYMDHLALFDKHTYDNKNNEIYNFDEHIATHSYLKNDNKQYYSFSNYTIIIEAGYKHWYIDIKRYRIKEEDPITIELSNMSEDDYWKMRRKSNKYTSSWWIKNIDKDEKKSRKKFSDAPLAMAIYYTSDVSWDKRNKPTIYNNPILKDLPGISGQIDPTWIWQSIYDYISNKREKEIVDNRTDIQHLESAGFDKKTSFRNIK